MQHFPQGPLSALRGAARSRGARESPCVRTGVDRTWTWSPVVWSRH